MGPCAASFKTPCRQSKYYVPTSGNLHESLLVLLETLMQTVTRHGNLNAVPSPDAQPPPAQNIMSAIKAERHLCSQHAQLILMEKGQAWQLRTVQP